MYNLTVLPASTAAILINGWCKAKHLNGYFICLFLFGGIRGCDISV
jgi:hypothetical protein